MVDTLICYLYSRSAWFCASHLLQPYQCWRTGDRSVGMVCWKHHGHVHSEFRYVPYPSELNLELTISVAELVSAYPTAGGMYFVTKHVVPPKHVAIWSWVIGWCNFLGQAAGVASLAFSISQMILATAVMHSTFVDGIPSFIPYGCPGIKNKSQQLTNCTGQQYKQFSWPF